MRFAMVRLRMITVLWLHLGCTPMPPRPGAAGDSSPPTDALDAPTDGDAPASDVVPDGDAPATTDVFPDADVALLDAPVDMPDAPPPGAARLTGAFVSSGSTSPRLSGGFVWHGGSSRLTGWLQ